MRCDVLAQGVVDAAKEININVPLVVRLAGTNFIEGKEILDNSGLKLISADNLESTEASDQEPSAEESTAAASESQESLISENLSDNEPQAEAAVEEDDQK